MKNLHWLPYNVFFSLLPKEKQTFLTFFFTPWMLYLVSYFSFTSCIAATDSRKFVGRKHRCSFPSNLKNGSQGKKTKSAAYNYWVGRADRERAKGEEAGGGCWLMVV